MSPQVVETLLHAQRDSTLNLYSTYLIKWQQFCTINGLDCCNTTVAQGLNFLQELFDEGNRQYSAINTARSALSLFLNLPVKFGEHPDVVKFMKAINNLKPSVPRYIHTWDPDMVLNLFLVWSPAKKLSLELLTMKTVVLILLVSGKRPQIIRNLNVDNMVITASSFKFTLSQADVKEGRRNYKVEPLVLKKYPTDKRLCVYNYLTVYLQRTLDIRGTEKALFLTTTKPHRQPSSDTVSRWIRKVLGHAGVDTTNFTPGSTRAASTSKAQRGGTPLEDIMRAAGWSRQSTFTTYYNKPLAKVSQFATNVLKM